MLSSAQRPTLLRSRPAARTQAVCVVDPQADGYSGWAELAQASGVQLQIVASAEEALRLSRTQAIDLWVVNTALPGLSGFELTSMLKTRSAQAAVYLVADHYTPEVERLAWQSRASMFGCKGAQTAWLEQWLAAHGRTNATAAGC